MILRFILTIVLCGVLFSSLVVYAQTAQPVVAPWSDDEGSAQVYVPGAEDWRNAQEPSSSVADRKAVSDSLASSGSYEVFSSALEQMYSARSESTLNQFGYDLFGVPDGDMRSVLGALAEKSPSVPTGAVQDHFVLNMGDELEVLFTGQRTDRGLYKVDSQGLLKIADFPPIPAAGRTIGQVRISVEAAAQNLYNTVPYISLASVRQIGVLVIGHVKRPGRQSLTVFHTVLDALMGAGGVQKTGSLRRIRLVRGGHSTVIDLYDLLLQNGENSDLQLRDGDRLIVPAIGPTLAIAGEVKRPGIYEVRAPALALSRKAGARSEVLRLEDMLELGGGVLAPGKNRFLMLSTTFEGRENVREVGPDENPMFGDGALLVVAKGSEKRSGTVELRGHTRRPGLHAQAGNKSLAALFSSGDVAGPDIYPLIGVIERQDPIQLSRKLLDFPLNLVLKKKYDRALEEGDVVHLFSNEQIRNLFVVPDKNSLLKTVSAPLPDHLENKTAQLSDEVMNAFLRERAVFLRGALRVPGAYPVAQGITLENVLAAAGGAALEADTSNIEVTAAHGNAEGRRTRVDIEMVDANSIVVSAGDSVRVNQRFDKIVDKSALVLGEVRNPGRYDLLPGDRISDLLARAGGLTDQAYPLGAIFSRESERRAEEARFKAQARDIEQSVASALEADDDKVNAEKISEARRLASALRNAQGVGRLIVEANPAALSTQSELDMLLEPGDRLFIPKRNLTVRVSGEVLSPASLQFRENKASADYINESGGFTFNADKDRTFVIYPDGSAQPLAVSSWRYNPVMIPPGSTIVVPRDPKPFDFMQSAKDVSQILSNLAITSIFINDIDD
ncbi:MAG: SLBB domain-containing protein [Alphaproteobacteria bacterium]|nr:SLBB domain-containing protein [Alphaproteobacteria bacterium]